MALLRNDPKWERDVERGSVTSSDVESGTRLPRSKPIDLIPVAIALFAVSARWLILRATHSTTEDFLITLRYADNLAGGRGFVYNSGEHVLGTTTPLYTLILSLASLVQLDATTVGKSLNILADGATVWLICRLGARLGHRRAGWVAGLLYAAASAPISVSIGGMETALVTCTGLVSIYAFIRKKPFHFAVSSATLFLLRIDGLLLTAILALAWLFHRPTDRNQRGERLGLKHAALFAILIAPWVIFAFAYFGSPLPTSMLAKLAIYARSRPGALPNLGDFRTQFVSGPAQIAVALLFLLGAILSLQELRPMRPVLLWLAVYYAAMLVSRVPAFGWYFLPPLPVYYLCAGNGLGFLVRSVAPRLSYRASVAAVVILAMPLTWHLRSITRDIASAQRLEDDVRRPLGEWLANNAGPNDTIMLEPIGYIGYYSGLRVLDMTGLVSPQVIPCYSWDVPNPLAGIALSYHPDWLILRPDERKSLDPTSTPPYEGGWGQVRGEYVWVRAFPDPDSGPAFEIYRRNTGR